VKIGVGISGGVDSAVTALLLREQGHEIVGYTMTLGRADEEASLDAARRTADSLDIPLTVCSFDTAWRKNVLDDLRDEYLAGRTPNPCVRCNETVKFNLLPRRAFADGCARFATGHYARTLAREEGGVRLLRAVDRTKDQSYFLYRVDADVLSRTLFPLGGMTKSEVRARAAAAGLTTAARGDSQDFCGGDPLAIVGELPRGGNIVDTAGKVLGRHNGYWRYTVGKRKGLGIGGGTPYYVVRLEAARNEVVVAFREEAQTREFSIARAVWFCAAADIASAQAAGTLRVKVRSAGEPKGPVSLDGGVCRCPDGILGVAPGQSAVFYSGDDVLGGGIIAPPA
jgi:tRNA-specific 2-thiouridylase